MKLVINKKDIYFTIGFILIVVISLTFLFQTSYAKYRKQLNTTLSATIASWQIKVNNEMIINKTTLDNAIVPVIDSSQYTKANTIAPGSTAYFVLTFDTSLVDVDFTYTITESRNASNNLADFKITGYELNNSGTINSYTGGSITGNLTKNTATTTVKVYLEWVDDTRETMNNRQDTLYAYNTASTTVNISVNFTQRQGT